MKGREIKEVLEDLELSSHITSQEFDDRSFERIADIHSLESDTIFFCGSMKFWNKFIEKSRKGVFVIFAKKFYEQVKDQLNGDLDFATVENLPVSMSLLSRPFYNESTSSDNDEVDGRQLGTCEIHPTAMIAQNVFIGANVSIGKNVKVYPGCVILSHSSIGEGSTLYPNVSIMGRTQIGKNTRIHSSAVIGSDGFGYNFHEGHHLKLWHMGGVIVGDDVEMGSNSSIDQGTFSPTVIGDGTKIDNLVHIAHNSRLDRGVILCGQVGLAGSVKIGAYSVLGGQVAVAPDVEIGAQVQVGGQAGVTGNIDDKEKVAGHPARPLREWLKGVAYLRKMALKK